MINERSAKITIGGEEYELLLTTRATKEIGKRYGGIENLGTKLAESKDLESSLDEVIWLITLLANQPIAIYNLKHPNDPKPLLTAEEVELLTTPFELAEYNTAILAAMGKGARRNVLSEEDESKNTAAG